MCWAAYVTWCHLADGMMMKIVLHVVGVRDQQLAIADGMILLKVLNLSSLNTIQHNAVPGASTCHRTHQQTFTKFMLERFYFLLTSLGFIPHQPGPGLLWMTLAQNRSAQTQMLDQMRSNWPRRLWSSHCNACSHSMILKRGPLMKSRTSMPNMVCPSQGWRMFWKTHHASVNAAYPYGSWWWLPKLSGG